MLLGLMNLFSLCGKPCGLDGEIHQPNGVLGGGGGDGSSGGSREGKEGLLWYRDIGKYGSGDFSMAVIQANLVLEDQSQIESGQFGTFVGIYDGHGGPEAARYVCDHLFRHFRGSSLFLGVFSKFKLCPTLLTKKIVNFKMCSYLNR